MRDAHGNYNNLLIVGPEGGTNLAEEVSQQHHHGAPMTAIDRVHSHEFEDEEIHEHAPLLAHEAPSLTTYGGLEVDPVQHGRRTSLGIKIGRVHTFVPPEPTHEDLKDPELERFPGHKSGILDRMNSLKQELPIDDSSHLDNSGRGQMAYDLSRYLAHLKPDGTRPEILFVDYTKPKTAADEETESTGNYCNPDTSDFHVTDLLVREPGALDGATENAAFPLQQSSKSSKPALVGKSTSMESSYGTLKPVVNETFTTKASRVQAAYVSIVHNTLDESRANNASTGDRHGSVLNAVGSAPAIRSGSKGSSGGGGQRKRPWIDKVAAGVAMVTVGVLLIGGWFYVTLKEKR